MYVADGGFEDLYPYELFLEEGFSHLYEARLTLVSAGLYTHEDLSELVDTRISLSISQVLRDTDVKRTRYLHGIVTTVAVEGCLFSGRGQKCYRYTLTIESELAWLRFNARNGVYYRQSPVDAVETVLIQNHITALFPDTYIKRNEYSNRLMFNQNGISDLDFIGNILFTYGISFTCVHPAAPEDAVGAADLIFSDGSSFPVPVVEYSDGREVPETAQFDFILGDQNSELWKMDAFRMENRIGVDGIEVIAAYPEFNYGNEEWKAGEIGADQRSITYNRLFSGYERGTAAEEIDADMERILAARFRTFELAKRSWTGKADNLLLMPGALFELAHYYGEDDDGVITALVSAAKTHVRAVWPESLAVKPELTQIGELAETEFACIDYAAGVERRFCGSLSTGRAAL
jgi:uncharacterized protein involved in type VI secretion and phage assembly